jgi:hypothetical protein
MPLGPKRHLAYPQKDRVIFILIKFVASEWYNNTVVLLYGKYCSQLGICFSIKRRSS